MLNLYRYMLGNQMKDSLVAIPDPYQTMLRNEYVAKVEAGTMTVVEYEALTKETYQVQ